MKIQRLVIMNGHRILQESDAKNGWIDLKVSKASARPPGVYKLQAASPARIEEVSIGIVMHVDLEHVYQRVGDTKELVKHPVIGFAKLPRVGFYISVSHVPEKVSAGASASG